MVDLAFKERDGVVLTLKTVNEAFNMHYTMGQRRLPGGEPSS
jgi:hypothetical protein